LDCEFLQSLIPHIYTSHPANINTEHPDDILKAQLDMVPVGDDIKHKWYQTWDTLQGQNNDTMYKYRQYFEALVSVPFRVNHEPKIPNHTLTVKTYVWIKAM
jgi:hypothetical protein